MSTVPLTAAHTIPHTRTRRENLLRSALLPHKKMVGGGAAANFIFLPAGFLHVLAFKIIAIYAFGKVC